MGSRPKAERNKHVIRYTNIDHPTSPKTMEEVWAAVLTLSNPIFDASVSEALAAQVQAKGEEARAALDRALATVELAFFVLDEEPEQEAKVLKVLEGEEVR